MNTHSFSSRAVSALLVISGHTRPSLKWSLLLLATFFLQAAPSHAQDGPNLVENGSFEDPAIPDGGLSAAQPTGWTSDVGFEIWRGLFGFLAPDGSQYLEMDVDENSTILQDLATVPGTTYRLSFAVANRDFGACPCTDISRIEASWDGNVVLTAEQTEGDWRVFETTVTATAATTRLQLRAAGESDTLGDFLDDVRVVEQLNLVENGSFEDPTIPDGSFAGGPLAGWTSDVGFEIWRGLFGFMAHDGSQYLEMDVNENSTIFQDLATVPGATYRLSFAVANRDFEGCGGFCSPVSRIEASWDGNVVLTAERTEGSWRVFETTVTATAATTRLQLRAAGESDTLGDLLDDVRVASVKPHVITGVVDAAGFQALIAPGSIVSVFGNFTETTATASAIPLSENLGGFSVTFNDIPGALFGVFDAEFDQSNVQAPWNLDVSSGKLEVKVHWEHADGEVWSEPFEVNAALASPGIYMYPPGTTQGAVVNFKPSEQDDVIAGSWAQASGSVDPVVGQPAAIGGVVTIWGSGLGPVSPLPATGDIPPPGIVPFTHCCPN